MRLAPLTRSPHRCAEVGRGSSARLSAELSLLELVLAASVTWTHGVVATGRLPIHHGEMLSADGGMNYVRTPGYSGDFSSDGGARGCFFTQTRGRDF